MAKAWQSYVEMVLNGEDDQSLKMAFYGGAVALSTFMNVPDDVDDNELEDIVVGLADELEQFKESLSPERN